MVFYGIYFFASKFVLSICLSLCVSMCVPRHPLTMQKTEDKKQIWIVWDSGSAIGYIRFNFEYILSLLSFSSFESTFWLMTQVAKCWRKKKIAKFLARDYGGAIGYI